LQYRRATIDGVSRRPRADYCRVWQQFKQLERLAPHRADWADWAAGHRYHRLFALLLRESAALEEIERAQDPLRNMRGVELHPRGFFHVTLQSLGFDGEVECDSGALLDVLAHEPAFELELGGVNAFRSAVFLEVQPGRRLLDLRQHIRRVGGAPLTRLDPFPGYTFHLTLGYFDASASATSVREAIRPLRRRRIARICCDEVTLVELPTDQSVAYPPLEAIKRFPLGRSDDRGVQPRATA
jgi:2'-5' RNA ligase